MKHETRFLPLPRSLRGPMRPATHVQNPLYPSEQVAPLSSLTSSLTSSLPCQPPLKAVPMAAAVPTALNKEAWRTAPMTEVLTASVTVDMLNIAPRMHEPLNRREWTAVPTPLPDSLLSLPPPLVETLRLPRVGVWCQTLIR